MGMTPAESERNLIGSIILRPSKLESVQNVVSTHFLFPAHAAIWHAITKIRNRGEEITVLSIDDQLIADGSEKLVGGPCNIAKLIEGVISPELAPYYAKSVVEESNKRELLKIAEHLANDAKDSGFSSLEAIDYATRCLQTVDQGGPREKLKTYSMSDFTVKPTNWVFRGLIPDGACIVVGAEEKTGKTWFLFDLAICLASGQDLLGEFKPGGTATTLIYSPESGHNAVARRMHGLCWGRNLNPEDVLDNIKFIDGRIDLASETCMHRMRETINELKPMVLIIDPLVCAHTGIDENKANEMQGLLDNIRGLEHANPGMSIIVSHHLNKGNKDKSPFHGFRGSTALGAWADGRISIRRVKHESYEGVRKVDVEHRDAMSPDPVLFTIVQAALPRTMAMHQDVYAYRLDCVDEKIQIDATRLADVLDAVRNNDGGLTRCALANMHKIRRETFNRYFDILLKQGKVKLTPAGAAILAD
jgi:hypothetical protein